MRVTREEVEHVARLAHLGLEPTEIATLAEQLTTVLDHVARLQTLDTSAVDLTSHAVRMHSVMRDDVAGPSWPPAAVLANAPVQRDDQFEVQAVLD